MSSLVKLAEEILGAAKAIETHLQSQGLPDATFDNDLLGSLPLSLQNERKTLINSSDRLKRLSTGVYGYSGSLLSSVTEETSLRAIYKYKIANKVPLEGSCSYRSLAASTGLTEPLVRRFLRHCMGNYIFAQTSEGQVRHNAFSRELATEPEFADAIGLTLEETAPSCMFLLEALQRFGESGEQKETGFALQEQAFEKEARPLQTLFEVLGQFPERQRRFGAAMRSYSKGYPQGLESLLTGFDWTSIDKPGTVLVDLGGGHGTVSQFLAQNTQNLHFVVQDHAETVRTGKKLSPVELQGRVEFEAHDFLKPQERVADVFFTRWIFHNWADKYAVAILKNLIPAMKEGSQVILFEYLMTNEPETSPTDKHGL